MTCPGGGRARADDGASCVSNWSARQAGRCWGTGRRTEPGPLAAGAVSLDHGRRRLLAALSVLVSG
jgi:hypothetical protein